MEMIIASSNVHKIREFREMFKRLKSRSFELFSLLDFPDYTPPEENGGTFQENALIKARHAAKALQKWVIADDSGLTIPALKGIPGIHSRRYAGPDATDSENRKKLLKAMAALRDLDRHGYFECAIALCSPEGTEKCFSGICEGVILEAERGGNGFGYDPLFRKHDYDKTFAELNESIKNKISHRFKAFEKLTTFLEGLSQ